MRLGTRILYSLSSTAHKICLFPTHKPRFFWIKSDFLSALTTGGGGRCVCCCELVQSLLPEVQKARTLVTRTHPRLHSWQLPFLSLVDQVVSFPEEMHEAFHVHFSSSGSQTWVGIRIIGRTYLNTDSRAPPPEFLFQILDGAWEFASLTSTQERTLRTTILEPSPLLNWTHTKVLKSLKLSLLMLMNEMEINWLVSQVTSWCT